MPDPDKAKVKPVIVPESVTVYLALKDECRKVVGLTSVTQDRNGRNAVNAVYAIEGVGKGTTCKNAWNSEGVDGWRDARSTQPSSALRLACSQALEAMSESTVPPTLPCASGLIAVSHVLAAILVLESR